MSYQKPNVPFELLPSDFPEDFEIRCDELWSDIVAEVCDETYYWQAHYKRQTYDNGCRGPLCKKFLRDASRSRPRAQTMYAPRLDRIYDPIIDFYKIIVLKLVTEEHLRIQNQLKGAV